MSVAQYIIKEHIETLLSADGVKLYPGKWAQTNVTPDSTPYGPSFGLYTTVPNSLYLMPYLKTDNIQIKLYSKSYAKVSGYLETVLNDLNRLNQHENTVLYDAFVSEGLYLKEVSARATSMDHNEFIEGSEYFMGMLDIMVEYG